MVTNTPVLTYFDLEKPVLITMDSRSTGLGAALIQFKMVNQSHLDPELGLQNSRSTHK